MVTQQQSGFERRFPGRLRRSAALGVIGVALALGTGCGAPGGAKEEPRYPEKRRPPPLRSASDGEVMGAFGQAPDDTLEASPTNLHPAHGWEGEKGGTERAREADCDPETAKARPASATAGEASVTNASTSATNTSATSASSGHPHSKPCPKKPAVH
jgi:hypothetical protein